MPIWAPALTAAGFTQADVHSAFHTIIYDAPGPGVPAPRRAAGRHHPGPASRSSRTSSRLATSSSPWAWPGSRSLPSCATPTSRATQHPRSSSTASRPGRWPGSPTIGWPGAARLPRSVEATVRGSPIQAETGLTAGLAEASALERALVLGGRGVRLASPALAPLPTEFEPAPGVERRARPSVVRAPANGPASSAGSAAIRTSGSRSTAPSRPCGSASSSACSATGSTRSRSRP